MTKFCFVDAGIQLGGETDFATLRPVTMKQRDIFGLALRIVGLGFLFVGLNRVPEMMNNFCANSRFLTLGIVWANLFAVGWPLLMAAWLVAGAPQLMRLAYSERLEPGDETSAPRQKQG